MYVDMLTALTISQNLSCREISPRLVTPDLIRIRDGVESGLELELQPGSKIKAPLPADTVPRVNGYSNIPSARDRRMLHPSQLRGYAQGRT